MSAKTLLVATMALAATTAMTLPSLAAGPNGPGPGMGQGNGPYQNQMNQGGPGNGPGDQQQPPNMSIRAQIFFNMLDRNGDGAVDKDELNVVRDAIFAALDTDKDGKLTAEELRSVGRMMGEGPRRGGPGFGKGHGGDRHGDFRMGRGDDERGGWQGRHGGQRGGDQDYRHGPRGPGMGPGMGRMGYQDQGNQQGQRGPQGGLGQQAFATLDTNGDGAVSQEEFAAAPLPAPFTKLAPQQ